MWAGPALGRSSGAAVSARAAGREAARCAEIVAHRGHAIEVEPEYVGVERFLGSAGRLRHAVQRRIVAGVQARATRHAGRRRCIVTAKLDAGCAKGVLRLQIRGAKGLELGRFIDRISSTIRNRKLGRSPFAALRVPATDAACAIAGRPSAPTAAAVLVRKSRRAGCAGSFACYC